MSKSQNLKRYITRALDSAEGIFARLVFVGSLRDTYTGHYCHEGWARLASAEEIHAALSDVHEVVFSSVLRLSLIDLSKELRLHFERLSQPEAETALLWLQTEPFRDLIPPRCSPAVRELFVSQVTTALEVLRRAPDWSELVGPIASPPQPPDQSLPPHWRD